MYRDPIGCEAVIAHLLGSPNTPDEVDASVAIWPQVREAFEHDLQTQIVDLLKGKSPVGKNRWETWLHRYYKWVHLPAIDHVDQSPAGNVASWLKVPGFVFLLAVVMPCMLRYQRTPWKLYQAAINGDFQALEILVRIDAEVLQDQVLGGIVFRMRNANRGQYQLLQQARESDRRAAMSLQEVKYLLGGLISEVSREMQSFARGETLFQVLRVTGLDSKRLFRRRHITLDSKPHFPFPVCQSFQKKFYRCPPASTR